MLYLSPPEDLSSLLVGEPSYRAKQLERWLYRTPVLDTSEMTNLSTALRERLQPNLWPFRVVLTETADDGATRKLLFKTPRETSIESVIMGYPRRTTLCLSSQAGCAMGCTFCATGQFGFERQLEPGEIIAQVAYASAILRKEPLPDSPSRITNVVFMGMGEPLANYRRVREALRRMIDIMKIPARAITVSTVGIVPGIRKLADEPWPVNLAISLHATTDELRSSIVPINERYPLHDLIAEARNYFERKGRRVTIEWALISGENDQEEEAVRLAVIAQRMRAHINVIPLNPTPLTAQSAPSAATIQKFMSTLQRQGANATLRNIRGASINAACGQLRLHAEGDSGRLRTGTATVTAIPRKGKA